MIATLAAMYALSIGSIRLETIKGHPWLIEGNTRFRLPMEAGNWEWLYSQGDLLGWPVGKGRLLKRVAPNRNWELLDLALYEDGVEISRLDFNSLGLEWLRDDAKWGGHERANNLRYLASRAWLSQVIVEPWGKPTSALGILTIQNLTESVQPAIAQALVKITFEPTLKARFIMDLGYLNNTNQVVAPSWPRIFLVGGVIWVAAEDGIREVNPAGNLERLVVPFAKGQYPIGQIGNQGILIGDSAHKQMLVWRPTPHDYVGCLSSMVPMVFAPAGFGDPIPINPDDMESAVLGIDGRLLAFLGPDVIDPVYGKSHHYPDRVLPWKDYAVMWDGKVAKVYEGETGRLVATCKRHN
ncbi:MAG: hypothetical protein JST12_02015 [Armatimonadetes bacterium]|nr:hypothetical protein [Armatimonadota bacterium]